MNISYKNKRIERVCTDVKHSDRTYGKAMSIKIQMRMNELEAADTVEEIQVAYILEIVDYHS